MTEPPGPRDRLRRAAAVLSIAASLIHVALSPEHFEEWFLYGLFFFFAGFAQVGYGFVLLFRSWEAAGPLASLRWERRMYHAGIVGNTFLILLYAFTRLVGVPLGPDAGGTEPVTPAGVFAKSLEVALVATLWVLVRRTSGGLRSAEPAAPSGS